GEGRGGGRPNGARFTKGKEKHMARDLVSLRQDRAKAYEKLEALVTASTPDDAAAAEQRQKDIDAAAGAVAAVGKGIANGDRLSKLKGGTAAPPDADPNAAKTFFAKYRDLPAAMHVVEKDQALSAAQTAAFADLLASVRATAVSGGRVHDDRLVTASLGS